MRNIIECYKKIKNYKNSSKQTQVLFETFLRQSKIKKNRGMYAK